MSLYKIMMKRRSVRYFKNQKIPENIINELLDVANNAPSGGNIQPISIILVQDDDNKKNLAKTVGDQPWVRNAPLSMIFCIDFYKIKKWATISNVNFRGENSFSHFLIAYADIMCAAENVVILAESYGLGSVYVGSIQSAVDLVRDYFSIPKNVLPMMILSIGYPESIPKSMPKLNKNFVIHNEKYKILSEDEIKEAYDEKYGDFDEDVNRYLEKAYIEVIEADKQQIKKRTKSVIRRMKNLEIKNHAQFLFKLRYPSDLMVKMNELQFKTFKEAGFDFSL
jgi:nitroreductase